jgi:DNA replication protein DnaC
MLTSVTRNPTKFSTRLITLLHHRLRRVDVLILDELGFVPFERAGGELLFDLISERHELCSTVVTTNLSFGEWVQVFGEEKLTSALLDRLGHHAHVLSISGSSYRTRKRRDNSAEEQPMDI